VIAFFEPPQADVIEKILRGHQIAAMVGGLWHSASPRAPPDGEAFGTTDGDLTPEKPLSSPFADPADREDLMEISDVFFLPPRVIGGCCH
jgi:hypothetical protein